MLTSASLFSPAFASKPPAARTHLEADRVYQTNNVFHSQGNVFLLHDNLDIQADWAKYDSLQEKLEAGNHVTLRRDGDTVTGNDFYYYLKPETGGLRAPCWLAAHALSRADGKQLWFEGKKKYRITEGRFTTCRPGNNDWYLHANTLTLNENTHIGIAKHAWLEFKTIPLLYLPWIRFPLGKHRTSGFLTPKFRFNRQDGLALTVPFYWNIAPQYDATFYPRVIQRRGVMLGGEFRYLQPHFQGKIEGALIQDRTRPGKIRSTVQWQHQQRFNDRLQGLLNIRGVSDDDYIRDFSYHAGAASEIYLPRKGQLSYRGDQWVLHGLVEQYQTLQAAALPYNRLPQLTLSASLKGPHLAQLDVRTQITRFKRRFHPKNKDAYTGGHRIVLSPALRFPWTRSYGFLTPELSLHATQYTQLEQKEHTLFPPQSRLLPLFSVDSGLFFERTIRQNTLIHTLEPRFFYTYIPYRDQRHLPNFDSDPLDLSAAELFTKNLFSGDDRIGDNHQLTTGLTTRLYQVQNGSELLRAMLVQRFYLTPSRVMRMDPGRDTSLPKRFDWLFRASTKLLSPISIDLEMQYEAQPFKMSRNSLALSWTPETGKRLNLRYTRNEAVHPHSEQYDLSAQWPIGKGWHVMGRYRYSFKTRDTLETVIGLEYDAGCWGLQLARNRYRTANHTFNTHYFLRLELKGFAGIGSSPRHVL